MYETDDADFVLSKSAADILPNLFFFGVGGRTGRPFGRMVPVAWGAWIRRLCHHPLA